MDALSQSHLNRLLQLLNSADFDRLRPHLERVEFAYRQSLFEPNRDIQFAYFPIEGVASLVSTMEDGSAAEVGTIGNEGMVGHPLILGDRQSPTSAYIQVPGFGLRLPAAVLRQELEANSSMRIVMLHYVHAFFNQVAQSAACSHFHNIEQRCCRWLLMTHDRVQSDRFLLTQEFLGMMLGVQRSSVGAVASQLKRRKLIDYRRGQVTVVDRSGLERLACECYSVSKHEFDRLLEPRRASSAAG
jgi:CRP-like cAMP-binding protein